MERVLIAKGALHQFSTECACALGAAAARGGMPVVHEEVERGDADIVQQLDDMQQTASDLQAAIARARAALLREKK